MVHKIQVSFTDEQWELISKYKGIMGKTGAELVRNITLAWLAEKSIISTATKQKMMKKG